MIDYGPGDMVIAMFLDEAPEDAPRRPVMVCSVGPTPLSPDGPCPVHGFGCNLIVHFVDWPEPVEPWLQWCACAFRKVIEPGAEMDQKVREREPA